MSEIKLFILKTLVVLTALATIGLLAPLVVVLGRILLFVVASHIGLA